MSTKKVKMAKIENILVEKLLITRISKVHQFLCCVCGRGGKKIDTRARVTLCK